MRDLPGHQPEVEDVVEINKELCSDHWLCRSRCTVLWKADTGLGSEPGTLVQALLATPARENCWR